MGLENSANLGQANAEASITRTNRSGRDIRSFLRAALLAVFTVTVNGGCEYDLPHSPYRRSNNEYSPSEQFEATQMPKADFSKQSEATQTPEADFSEQFEAIQMPEADFRTFIVDAANWKHGLTAFALQRLVSSHFYAKVYNPISEELEMHLVGPQTLGSKSEWELEDFPYANNPAFTQKNLQSEQTASWEDLSAYLKDGISDQEFIELVRYNFKNLTSINLPEASLEVKRDQNRKIIGVNYVGDLDTRYTVPVWKKNMGKWEEEEKKYELKKGRFILPPRADGVLKIPIKYLRDDKTLSLPVGKQLVKVNISDLSQLYSRYYGKFDDALSKIPARTETIYTLKLNPSPLIKEITEMVVQDANTPEEKIKKVFKFVVEKVGYMNLDDSGLSTSPEVILLNGKGNCSEKTLLFNFMLASIGLPSYYLDVDVFIGIDEIDWLYHAAAGVTGDFSAKSFAKNDKGQEIYYLEVAGGQPRIGRSGFPQIQIRKVVAIEPSTKAAN